MPNDFSQIIPQLLAGGLATLRQLAIMPRLVNRDYDTMAAQQGAVITVPIPSAIVANDVTPGFVPPTTGTDVVPTTVLITLDQWKEAAFTLTDKEELEAMNGVIPMQAQEAIKALANKVDIYILSFYKGIYGFRANVDGSNNVLNPFATDTSDATAVRAILKKQLAPEDALRFVLNPDAEANALNLRAFQDISWNQDASVINNGTLQRKLGFSWFTDQNVPTHTAGTITTGLICKASTAVAVGATSFAAHTAASTGACALLKGDIILIAGDTQTYVLTADATQASAATDVTLAVLPAIKLAKVGSEAITVYKSHSVNLGFHRDAFAFASRPMKPVDPRLGSIELSAVDEVSGLSLRLEVRREHKQTRYSYDILYGAQLVRRELACRLAGAAG